MSAIVSWALLGIFARALHHKVSAWPRFKAVLAAYRILPRRLVSPAAAVLAGLELSAVILLAVLQPAGLWLAAALFALYLAAMAINRWRGNAFIDCGCGDEPTLISNGLLVRNGVLIVVAIMPVATSNALDVSPGVLVSSAGLAFALLLVYLSVDQLFANQSRHQRLWLARD